MNVPRLRMFAGPNGSGKSTIKRELDAKMLGAYINPDEIQAKAAHDHFLDLAEYNLQNRRQRGYGFFPLIKAPRKRGLHGRREAVDISRREALFRRRIL